MLLWHGSRISNFVGILSQGLRIAPPEAPVSGYLFGKGIYLADMAEKSIHYCRSFGSDTALILLIEVISYLISGRNRRSKRSSSIFVSG
jgi:poly [ADP-ribose] polymerase